MASKNGAYFALVGLPNYKQIIYWTELMRSLLRLLLPCVLFSVFAGVSLAQGSESGVPTLENTSRYKKKYWHLNDQYKRLKKKHQKLQKETARYKKSAVLLESAQEHAAKAEQAVLDQGEAVRSLEKVQVIYQLVFVFLVLLLSGLIAFLFKLWQLLLRLQEDLSKNMERTSIAAETEEHFGPSYPEGFDDEAINGGRELDSTHGQFSGESTYSDLLPRDYHLKLVRRK